MERKRKISIRKVLQALVTLIVSIACMVGISAASKKQMEGTVNHIVLEITNEYQYQFLDKKTLMYEVVTRNQVLENKTPLSHLNLEKIEQEVKSNPWVRDAEVYLDNERNLHLVVSQRVPVARIFFENGKSHYLDTSLQLLPLSKTFSYYTTVVTNVPQYANDSMNKSLWASIISMVRFVDADSFWRAQISQISVTPEGHFELYPVLGTQIIRFGDTAHMEEKFSKLLAFYKNVSNKIGWDVYNVLDIRFVGQIVASPALTISSLPKNALSNMSWLKSIMDEEKTVQSEKKTPENTQKSTITTTNNNAQKDIQPKQIKSSPTNNKQADPKYIYRQNRN